MEWAADSADRAGFRGSVHESIQSAEIRNFSVIRVMGQFGAVCGVAGIERSKPPVFRPPVGFLRSTTATLTIRPLSPAHCCASDPGRSVISAFAVRLL